MTSLNIKVFLFSQEGRKGRKEERGRKGMKAIRKEGRREKKKN